MRLRRLKQRRDGRSAIAAHRVLTRDDVSIDAAGKHKVSSEGDKVSLVRSLLCHRYVGDVGAGGAGEGDRAGIQTGQRAGGCGTVAAGVGDAKPFPQEACGAFGCLRRRKLRDQRGLARADDAEFGVLGFGEKFREDGFGVADLIGRNVRSEQFRAVREMAVGHRKIEDGKELSVLDEAEKKPYRKLRASGVRKRQECICVGQKEFVM
jgi:hypothetical protein